MQDQFGLSPVATTRSEAPYMEWKTVCYVQVLESEVDDPFYLDKRNQRIDVLNGQVSRMLKSCSTLRP